MKKKIVMLEDLYDECLKSFSGLGIESENKLKPLAEVIEELYDKGIREYTQDPSTVGQMIDVFNGVLKKEDFSNRGICIWLYRENPVLYINVINNWFRPYRFGLEYLFIEIEYFYKQIRDSKLRLGDYEIVNGYYKIPIGLIPRHLIGRSYWFPSGDIENRKVILRKAIELLFDYYRKG